MFKHTHILKRKIGHFQKTIYIHSTRQICIRVHYKRLGMKFVQFLLNIQRKIYKKYNIVQMFNWKPTLFITQYCEVEWVFIITLKQSPYTTLTLPSLPLKGIQQKVEVFIHQSFILCTFPLSTIIVLLSAEDTLRMNGYKELPCIQDYIAVMFHRLMLGLTWNAQSLEKCPMEADVRWMGLADNKLFVTRTCTKFEVINHY